MFIVAIEQDKHDNYKLVLGIRYLDMLFFLQDKTFWRKVSVNKTNFTEWYHCS